MEMVEYVIVSSKILYTKLYIQEKNETKVSHETDVSQDRSVSWDTFLATD